MFFVCLDGLTKLGPRPSPDYVMTAGPKLSCGEAYNCDDNAPTSCDFSRAPRKIIYEVIV